MGDAKDTMIKAILETRDEVFRRYNKVLDDLAEQADHLGFWCKECNTVHQSGEGDYSGDPVKPYPGWPHEGCPPWTHACLR